MRVQPECGRRGAGVNGFVKFFSVEGGSQFLKRGRARAKSCACSPLILPRRLHGVLTCQQVPRPDPPRQRAIVLPMCRIYRHSQRLLDICPVCNLSLVFPETYALACLPFPLPADGFRPPIGNRQREISPPPSALDKPWCPRLDTAVSAISVTCCRPAFVSRAPCAGPLPAASSTPAGQPSATADRSCAPKTGGRDKAGGKAGP